MRLLAACALLLAAQSMAAQPGTNQDDLYTRARERVLNDIKRLPNYTCVQTITRSVYIPASPNKKPPRCEDIIGDRNSGTRNLKLRSLDRLRVDVAIVDKREMYSWVGATQFEESDLSKLVGGGQTVMGDFGSLVLSVFNDHPSLRFEGEKKIDGRRLLEFVYQTPVELSDYTVKVWTKFTTAYDGSVFLDPATGDVVRVTARSAILPEQSGYCQVTRDLDYARLRIDTMDTLIPREASSWAIDREGMEFYSASVYSSCRQYTGESVLRFDDPGTGPQPASPDAPNPVSTAALATIPPDLPFECRITTVIDSTTAAAGDPIEATLLTPITNSKGKVLAPAGARIHGRLITFAEHPPFPPRPQYDQLGVQLRSIELGGTRVPFRATLVSATLNKHAEIPHGIHPGTGVFVFYEKKLHLTTLDSKWVTSAPDTPVTPAR